MRIRITLLDMVDPIHPAAVLVWALKQNELAYPISHAFPIPASLDARTNHPYAIVVEDLDRRQ